MRRIALLAVSIAAISTSVLAQGRGAPAPPPPLEPGASQADVDTALLAAPGNLKEQATVVKWKPDFTYTTLRKGTNKLVCFDKSGMALQPAVSIECTNLGNLNRVTQNMKTEAEAGDRAKANAAFDALEKGGTRVKPEFGSVWYHVFGQDKDHVDREHTRTHMTIAVPGATSQTMGLPENGQQGGVWIMNAGTSTAHLMVPGE